MGLLLTATVLAAAACGGASRSSTTGRTTVRGLPSAARVIYASDAPVQFAHTSAADTGGVVASLPFVPSRDGFSFQNYGFVAGGDLDAHVMRELFGDVVCAGTPSDSCQLTPNAQSWAESIEAGAAGGHCYGFSVTALRFYEHNLSPADFGGTTTYSLPFSHTLQDEIAADWATQTLEPAMRAIRSFTPTQMISFLEHALAHPDEGLYTLTIWDAALPDRSEGHSITPIGIKDLGNGQAQILIYDNNVPGQTQAISVNTTTDSWSYNVATTPAAPSGVWSGSGTSNEMELTPVSTATVRQPCPFCSGANTDSVSLAGNPDAHGHLLITTSDGRRLGYANGTLVDEIPGARIVYPQLSEIWLARPEPIYQIPSRYQFTVTVEGQGATGRDPASLFVSGPGFGATATNLLPGPSTSYQLSVAQDQLQLRALGSATTAHPSLRLASERQALTLTAQSLSPGVALGVRVSPGGRVGLAASGSGTTSPLSLVLQTVGTTGTRTVQKSAPALSPGQRATFSFGLSR